MTCHAVSLLSHTGYGAVVMTCHAAMSISSDAGDDSTESC
jgi:hypothetical protein